MAHLYKERLLVVVCRGQLTTNSLGLEWVMLDSRSFPKGLARGIASGWRGGLTPGRLPR
jgi:hypothetical protein